MNCWEVAEAVIAIAAVLSGEKRWTVVCADNEDVFPLLADRSVGHIITDPPYDERTHTRARSLKDGGSDIPIDFAHLTDYAFVSEMLRISQRWVLAFCALEMLGEYQKAAPLDAWARAGIWIRTDGTPQISGDRPGQGAEGIAILHRADFKKRWNEGGKRGVWTCGVERVERFCPTPKPIKLMMELVEDFTDRDEVILDPFCCSATTGLAALRLGRRFIGVEVDPSSAAGASARLRAEAQGLSLHDVRRGQRSLFGG